MSYRLLSLHEKPHSTPCVCTCFVPKNGSFSGLGYPLCMCTYKFLSPVLLVKCKLFDENTIVSVLLLFRESIRPV